MKPFWNAWVVILFFMFISVSTGDGQWSILQAGSSSTGNGGGPLLRQANVFGLPTSVSTDNYYNPGVASQAVSWADWYYIDGFVWPQCWDASQWGAPGAAAIAANGSPWMNYFCIITPDHPVGEPGVNWAGGIDLRFGWTNDPQTMPQQMNSQAMVGCLSGGNNAVTDPYSTYPWCIRHSAGNVVYEPNDTGNVFHWYGEGTDLGGAHAGIPMTVTVNGTTTVTGVSSTAFIAASGGLQAGSQIIGSCFPANTYIDTITVVNSTVVTSAAANTSGSCSVTIQNHEVTHNEGVLRSNDLASWVLYGPTHQNYYSADASAFQNVMRLGSNSYQSYGNFYRAANQLTGHNPDASPPGPGVWTDTANGLTFNRPQSPQTQANYQIPSITPPFPSTGLANYVYGTTNFGTTSVGGPINISGQNWMCAREDRRNVSIAASAGGGGLSAGDAVITKYAHGYTVGTGVQFETTDGYLASATANGTNDITGLQFDATMYLSVGMYVAGVVSGSGNTDGSNLLRFPAGTTITSIDSSTEIHTSNPTAHTGSDLNLGVYAMPPPFQNDVIVYVKTVIDADHFTVSATPGGSNINIAGQNQTGGIFVPTGGMYVARVAVDSSFNVLASPAPVHISNAYSGFFPGPQYILGVNCQLESGILTYYVVKGFFPSTIFFGFNQGQMYQAGNHFPYNNGGAFQQQHLDIYSECVDPSMTLCYNSAPMGLKASAAAGVVSLSWNDTRPNQNYHLYYGTTYTSQPNFIGSVTGLSTTYTPAGGPGTFYFKLVSLDASNAEQGSRIVPAYVSSYGAATNAHMQRALQDGADPTTCNIARIDSIYSWLISHNHYNSLERGASASFCVKQDGSHNALKVYDIGTTRLPRGNDLWPCTNVSTICSGASTSTYGATTIGGTTPGITMPSGTFGIFGGANDSRNRNGIVDNIRRKVAMTIIASYQKHSPATGNITLLGYNQFAGFSLQHLAGTPDSIQFELYDDVTHQDATVSVGASNSTAPHVIAGTFGLSGNLIAYVDGTAGSAVTGLHANGPCPGTNCLALLTTLRGANVSSNAPVVNIGSSGSTFNYGSGALPAAASYAMNNSSAAFDFDAVFQFEDEWSAADIAAFSALL